MNDVSDPPLSASSGRFDGMYSAGGLGLQIAWPIYSATVNLPARSSGTSSNSRSKVSRAHRLLHRRPSARSLRTLEVHTPSWSSRSYASETLRPKHICSSSAFPTPRLVTRFFAFEYPVHRLFGPFLHSMFCLIVRPACINVL